MEPRVPYHTLSHGPKSIVLQWRFRLMETSLRLLKPIHQARIPSQRDHLPGGHGVTAVNSETAGVIRELLNDLPRVAQGTDCLFKEVCVCVERVGEEGR